MKRTRRGSPRCEPQRWYRKFCELMKRQPGELGLKISPESRGLETIADFNALVWQFFVDPKRWEHWVRLKPSMRAWREKRSYVRKKRESITDDLLMLLGRLYWNYAAWIILRGEYKAMKEAHLTEQAIENRLKKRYWYLPQVNEIGFFARLQKESSDENKTPLHLAYEDTAKTLRRSKPLSAESLRRMVSPGRLRKSPPASLIFTGIDPRELLSQFRRIHPKRKGTREQRLIRLLKSIVIPP